MSEQKNQKTRKWWLGLLGLLLLLEERPFWLNGLLLLKGLLFLLFAVFMRTPDPKIITAESGQDVTLTCRAPNNNNISVKWSRADLGDEYVLLYQDEQFDPANQHPSFKNRVDLQDRQMKDGDVSLILKDVTINDTGRYECRVFIEETRSWKLIIIIHLHVDPPVKRFRRRRILRVAVKRFRRRRILRVAVKRFRRRRILRVADQKNITAESGQNVTLTCRAPNNNINIVEWSRADLGDEYVLLYRDEQFVPDDQHPSFKNRVDLQDRQMKDGDVSLILKDVTINDTGTYECGVVQTGTEHLEFINTTNLHVDPPGHTGGHKDGDPKIITAESGQDVTLTCRAPNNNIIVVVWGRADLGDEYVFLYKDGHFVPDEQHPSFKNRVDLQDRQMKDGDVSLILKDVTINDAGRYECGVVQTGTVDLNLISIIHLHVVPPGHTGGSVGLKVGLSVPVVLLLVAVVGFLIYRKKKLNPTDPHELEHLQPECQKTITAESGQDVTLTCRAPDNNIRVVKWSRADLGDEYVLLYQDEQFVPDEQHPSFKNRVDLQDRQMKDGDVSLILKDVTINDAGTYECHVVQGVGGPVTLISSINLVIDPP